MLGQGRRNAVKQAVGQAGDGSGMQLQFRLLAYECFTALRRLVSNAVKLAAAVGGRLDMDQHLLQFRQTALQM